MQPFLISYVIPVATVVAVAFGFGGSEDMHVCQHSYALCTSALCIPQPDDPAKAICFCVVKEGPSMATTSCDKLAPQIAANGIRSVYSAFSLDQFNEGMKGMKCPDGTPWTWCLNKLCTVDPTDPQRAICVCDVMTKGEWMTLGGDCDTATCATGYWSGAGTKDFEEGNAFMTKAMGLKQSPAKWCAVSP